MKVQLALDDISLVDALDLAKNISNYVDIFEIGSPFIIEEGMNAVRQFRKSFPSKQILADTKIVDAGQYEAELAFKAGADYCTVVGITDELTIKECIKSANTFKKNIFLDTINMQNITTHIPHLEELGINHISVHVGVDQQAIGITPLKTLQRVKDVSTKSVLSVAGGINLSNLNQYKSLKPDIIIVGGGINHSDHPIDTAQTLYNKIRTLR